MTTRTTIRRTLTAAALAGAAGVAGVVAGGTADAATPGDGSSVLPCTSNQFTARLVYGGAGAGNRYAAIQLTGKVGERCALPGRLPVTLVGARDVLIDNEAPDDAPGVALSNGSSAYVQLHWTGIEAPDEQETPNGISVTAPAASNPHGDPIDPSVTLPWTLGPVDAVPATHTIDVGPLTRGTAPTE
ncbi:DUF4232 domain-containing protein [Actinophytocola oryzae]|uniref:Uncharacterized protein DUF4232 n=1 Tax=Actinophytocola oryzae TaxID=502181 RepID=A0A4R7W511_9PSEU|nr:DUF4232 domain-containing protein [Actinophytocola oryzae]TDV57642.1 uncharacterized protein DUF4232 [Actinophytocola oryzae]